jgi:hypothetical protein
MTIKTLHEHKTPTGSARVRLVERKVVQPMAIAVPSFVVVLDVAGHYASFESFGDIGRASMSFVNSVSEVEAAAQPPVSLREIPL